MAQSYVHFTDGDTEPQKGQEQPEVTQAWWCRSPASPCLVSTHSHTCPHSADARQVFLLSSPARDSKCSDTPRDPSPPLLPSPSRPCPCLLPSCTLAYLGDGMETSQMAPPTSALTHSPTPPGLHLHAGSRWGRIPNVLARSQGLAAQLGSWPGNLYQSPSFLSVQRRPAKSWAVFLPAPPCPVRYLPILCPLLPSTSQPPWGPDLNRPTCKKDLSVAPSLPPVGRLQRRCVPWGSGTVRPPPAAVPAPWPGCCLHPRGHRCPGSPEPPPGAAPPTTGSSLATGGPALTPSLGVRFPSPLTSLGGPTELDGRGN